MSNPAPTSHHPAEPWTARLGAGIGSDLRHAVRLLRKHLGFTSVALLTLALCIGANTAIFSAVYGLMLRPLPYPKPDDIVEVYNQYPKAGLPKMPSNVVQYLDYKRNATSYRALALWSGASGLFGEDAQAEVMTGARATADFFDVLAVQPFLGRFFTLENSQQNADKVVVLTRSFWERHFQADPAVIGRTVRFDGESYTVVGVAPREVEEFNATVRFILPYSWSPAAENPQGRHGVSPFLFGRLKTGVTPEQALAEARLIERRYYDAAVPPLREFIDRAGHQIGVGTLHVLRIEPLRSRLLLLQGGVAFVLLIGCLNVANLQLARANGRQAELAVRFALGASRGHIARQLFVENLLLTTAGMLGGLGVAALGVRVLNHYREQMLAHALPFSLSGQVLVITMAVTVLAALLITVVPLVHVFRGNLLALVHRSARGSSGGSRVRAVSSLLVVAQIAIALMLLTGAGLLIRSFLKATAVNPGFDPQGVVAARIVIPRSHRADDAAAKSFQERLVQAAKEIPGVSAASLSFAIPFRRGLPINALILQNDPFPPGSPQPGAYRVIVSPEYFAALRVQLIEGRFLEPADLAPGRRAFVVDETFARKYFPGRSAVGGRFAFGGRPQRDDGWATVVGVVRNVPHNGVEDRSGVPFVYQALGGRPGGVMLLARTERHAAEVIPLLREKLRALDPGAAIYESNSLEGYIAESFNERRGVMILLGSFAGLALFLSGIGIYGVLAYDVSQRTREIGVRCAIGASEAQVVSLIMRQGIWRAVIGLAIGLVGAWWLSRYLRSMLFDLSPFDPWSYGVVALLLLGVAAVASFLPARRAARISPLEALRVD
ncbi:ABC transporter permease [Opitutus sp. ER46]|uniref:ABC transporter permease n=1 Tax=Opitutus sp. ER46 TaxID=2161864 RepID=UPI001304BFC7|nr:ABC transporter permease [Opitutus sp. ER46]